MKNHYKTHKQAKKFSKAFSELAFIQLVLCIKSLNIEDKKGKFHIFLCDFHKRMFFFTQFSSQNL